jgi:peptidoglycan/LPS O-acetylase OafA/YrhL
MRKDAWPETRIVTDPMKPSVLPRSPSASNGPPSERLARRGYDRAPIAPLASPLRLDYVDGLRALAALWVAVHHTVELSVPAKALNTPVVGPIVGSLFFAQFAVMFFLLLSGFCLYYPCATKNPDSPTLPLPYGTYLFRRAYRIAPPYLCALAFCLVLGAVPALQCGHWEGVGTTDAGVILTHLFFVHNLIVTHATKIDPPMWSIGLEWQLYLLFPFLVWLFRKTRPVIALGLLLAVAVVIRATFRGLPNVPSAILRAGPFSYLELFGAGMIAAHITVQRRTIAPRWVLGTMAALGFAVVRLGSGNGLLHDLGAGSAAFCLLLLAADPRSATARLLSRPMLVRIGVFSYSIYLMHAPLLQLFWFALRPLRLSADARCLVLVAGCLPIIVVLCHVFHRLVERPFMQRKPAAKVAPLAPIEAAPLSVPAPASVARL